MVNKVILVGRLGNDPETRFTASGHQVTTFSLATDDGTEDNPRVNWHRVVVFGKQAEVCGEYLSKGRLVYVEGRVQYRQYEDQTGTTRYVTEIVANRVVFLGGNGNRETTKSVTNSETIVPDTESPDDSDLPF